jgi:hypothetical protein
MATDPNDRDGHKYDWRPGMLAIQRGRGRDMVFHVVDVRKDDWLGEPCYELLLSHPKIENAMWVIATYCEPCDQKEQDLLGA